MKEQTVNPELNPLDYRVSGNGQAYDVAEWGNGQFETGFFGADRPAWHGLGNVIPDDVVKAEDALELSGLDWEVAQVPVTYAWENQTGLKTRHQAIVRTTDGAFLGMLGSRYVPLQNREAFTFMDDLVDSGEAKYHTAGSLQGGRRVWLLARVNRSIRIGGDDAETIEPFLLLTNSHDGTSALTVANTPVRVVCKNTLPIAVASASRVWKARHTKGMTAAIAEARRTLQLTFTYLDEFEALGNELLAEKMDVKAFERFLKRLVPLPVKEDAGDRAVKNKELAREMILAVRNQSPNIDNVRDTRWGAFQAVAEYEDWMAPRRGSGLKAAESAFSRSISGDDLKPRALELLTVSAR